jgi:hypothetical protein
MAEVVWRYARRLLVGMSFLLCVGTALLWVRSCSTADSLDRYRQDVAGPGTYHDTRGVFSSQGRFGGGFLRVHPPIQQDWPADRGWRWNTSPAQPVAWQHQWRFFGFGYWNTSIPGTPGSGGMSMRGLTIPHWFVIAVLGVAPAIAGRRLHHRWRRRRRVRRGLCADCGYDVRASGERCPECGREVDFPLVPSPSGRRLG